MAFPGKRKSKTKNKAAAAPAKAPAPAKKLKATKPSKPVDFVATLAQLVKDAPAGGDAQTLLGAADLDDLWSKPRHFISTRSVALDAIVGGQGIPSGRLTEVYGPEGCLAADTFVHYEVVSSDDRRRNNNKGGTIARLYERFHGAPIGGDRRGKSGALEVPEASFRAPSINAEGRVFQNRIVDVVRTGTKPCVKITASTGEEIVATRDHKMWTGTSFVAAGTLTVGDAVFVHNNLRFAAVPTSVLSIEDAGDRETFDMRMESPFNNYVANGFVVHNSGKSTIVDQLIAEAQARGGLACLADTEHARDLAYMGRLGVDIERMPSIQAHSIESVFEHLRYWAVKGREALGPDVPMLYVWDSVAGTPTRAEMTADVDQKFQAEAAKVIKQQFRACTQIIAEHQVAFVVTNQVYKKMGNFYGPEDETYGGGGIKYHATLRIGLRYAGQVKPRGAGKEDRVPPIGQRVEAKVTKNKIAPPNRWRQYAIIYGYGVDNVWSLFEDLQASGVVVQNGSWYSLNPDAVGLMVPAWQGAHFGLADVVREHPDLYSKLLSLYAEKCK